jgi:uncharacterized protein YjbJ (UPF0337 family)
MSGSLDNTKGRLEEAAGDLTDDDRLRREGRTDQAAGTVKDKADDAKDRVEGKVDDVRDWVQDKVDGARRRSD